MKELYGASSNYYGCHHTKAVCISSAHFTILWIGSCNLTRASDYNYEMMVRIDEQHQLNSPRMGP